MQILGAMLRLLEVRVRGSFLLLRGSLAALERLEDLTARSAAGLADPAPRRAPVGSSDFDLF
jgi:hypothetical protein